jgi:hypothetical protein
MYVCVHTHTQTYVYMYIYVYIMCTHTHLGLISPSATIALDFGCNLLGLALLLLCQFALVEFRRVVLLTDPKAPCVYMCVCGV